MFKHTKTSYHKKFLHNLVFFSRKKVIMSSSDSQLFGFDQSRLVVKKISPRPQMEGVGAVVRRSIGMHELKNLDPFLMLDEFEVIPPAGFPEHPHRGFETVTYMLEGASNHQDFAGHKGTIRTGDVQWMTAGRGIVHSEMPAGEGILRGLQLWVNLSSKDKMIEPGYQELPKESIPMAEKDGVEVRVIAGKAMGVRSPVYTRTPTMFIDFTLQPNTEYHQTIPESWNAFVYIVEGEGYFGIPNGKPVPAHNLLVLGTAGEGLSVWNNSVEPLRFVLAAGEPINEPIVQYGPFVMNTEAEIQQTIEDFQYCKNGFENARYWQAE
ncbi:transcription cofactor [Lithospermum erythrorhizon]|uniref:Transcription cofactor n=1 Tax=Lithospermum erythrorhizon TaxID=34254 RepID=A0AAV3RTI9_LITER